MRLGGARASPRAAIPLPISLCILCSFVYRCVFVCEGMPNPSSGGNTPRTISDHAPVSVTIHIGSWLLEGCQASLTDIKGREEVGPQRRCMRKHNWGHDFIVLKVQVSSRSEVEEPGKRDENNNNGRQGRCAALLQIHCPLVPDRVKESQSVGVRSRNKKE